MSDSFLAHQFASLRSLALSLREERRPSCHTSRKAESVRPQALVRLSFSTISTSQPSVSVSRGQRHRGCEANACSLIRPCKTRSALVFVPQSMLGRTAPFVRRRLNCGRRLVEEHTYHSSGHLQKCVLILRSTHSHICNSQTYLVSPTFRCIANVSVASIPELPSVLVSISDLLRSILTTLPSPLQRMSVRLNMQPIARINTRKQTGCWPSCNQARNAGSSLLCHRPSTLR